MRMFLTCMACFQQNGEPSNELFSETPEDTGLYRMTCSAGHESVTCLQQMKFEVLFDIGAYAIADGYFREAVSSFSSALERAYEFYVEVQCAARGVSSETYEATWSQVARQSERQLGAFLFVRALCTNAAPLSLRNADVEFRNAVVHRGKIPTRAEALEYGQRALQVILQILEELRSEADAALSAAIQRHIARQRQALATENVAFMSIGTLVSLSRAEKQSTLVEWVEMLELQRSGRVAATGSSRQL